MDFRFGVPSIGKESRGLTNYQYHAFGFFTAFGLFTLFYTVVYRESPILLVMAPTSVLFLSSSLSMISRVRHLSRVWSVSMESGFQGWVN